MFPSHRTRGRAPLESEDEHPHRPDITGVGFHRHIANQVICPALVAPQQSQTQPDAAQLSTVTLLAMPLLPAVHALLALLWTAT